jgi:hypothetical protein
VRVEEDLLKLPMLQPEHVSDTLHTCQLAKRANSQRVELPLSFPRLSGHLI